MKKDRFKKIGTDILTLKSKPSSMEDFLKDEPDKGQKQGNHSDAQLHKCTDSQMHIPDHRENIFIRGDLYIKLQDEVHRRKKDQKINHRKATKRAVFEEALEQFFG